MVAGSRFKPPTCRSLHPLRGFRSLPKGALPLWRSSFGLHCYPEDLGKFFPQTPFRSEIIKWWRGVDLNHRPVGYEPNALSTELPRHKICKRRNVILVEVP